MQNRSTSYFYFFNVIIIFIYARQTLGGYGILAIPTLP